MIEELKIVAEIMKNVTDGALWGVVAYLFFSYIKPVTLTAICALVINRVVDKLCAKGPTNVIELEN
jgi:hypothetical protein